MNKNKKMPLIGISGKAGSGKDLVGNIIQYLIACKKYEGMDCFFADCVNKGFDLKADYTNISNWEIKKFADKLKDILCLLIGCTRKQWENDREFREKELGEEWWYYKLSTGELLDYNSNLHFEFTTIPLIKPTPRILLQQIGTNLFRNQLHPNVWINATMADYQPIAGTMDVRRSRETFPNWIITDVRFPNELKAIKDRGGICIRVERHNHPNDTNPNTEHESESALDNAKFDYIIENNGTIEELLNKVKKILINEKII